MTTVNIHTALALCSAAISRSEKPNSLSTASVFSPSSGGRTARRDGVRDSFTGWRDQPHLALVLHGHALRHAEMLDLRVGEHLVDRIDRPARHAGLVQALDPLGAGSAGHVRVDLGIERVAIFRARRAGLIVRILQQRRRFGGLAESLPDFLSGGGNVDVAVLGLEHAGRNAGRMIIAGLLRDFAARPDSARPGNRA